MMLFQRRLFMELARNTATTMLLLLAILVLVLCAAITHNTEGLTLLAFVRAVPTFAAPQVQLLLPLSVLVAVVLTYGRAAADNEVDTLRASGVHPLHVMTPGLLFGALASLALLACLDHFIPLAEVAKKRLQKDVDIAGLLRAKLSAGEPVELDDHTTISVDSFEGDRARGMRVLIYGREHQIERELVADSAELRVDMEGAAIEVTFHGLEAVRGPHIAGKETVITYPLPKDIADFEEKHLTSAQLRAWELRGREPEMGYTIAEASLTRDLRLASSMACLLFVVLGLPVALMFRRHDRTASFLVAFLLALFVYYPSREVSIALTRRGVFAPELAAWSGNAVLLGVGLVLCWRVFRR
jgi:lipopolysaccharide export system permease protein